MEDTLGHRLPFWEVLKIKAQPAALLTVLWVKLCGSLTGVSDILGWSDRQVFLLYFPLVSLENYRDALSLYALGTMS